MRNEILVVVDMQNDFVDGSLGTAEAKKILLKVEKKVESFEGKIIFTKDTHSENYPDTQEGKALPVIHCVKETWGWNLAGNLEKLKTVKGAMLYEKITFGCRKLAEDLAAQNEEEKIDCIEIVGLCTDICVVSNALLLKAFLPETLICVDASCCAGVAPDKHDAALETMRSCQIEIH